MPSRRLALIPARDGFRRRTVRFDRHVIALKRAQFKHTFGALWRNGWSAE